MEALISIRHAGCYTSELTEHLPVTITVLSGHRTDEGSIGLWELSGPDEVLPAAYDELRQHPNISRAEILQERPGAWILETVDTEAEVSNALIGAGLVFLPPVVIREGLETYRVFALTREQISRAVEALTPKNKVKVLALREHAAGVGPLGELTQKQREALEAAYKEGYYDWPRRIDQEALARKLGISRAALAERLARAERNLVEAVVGAQASTRAAPAER